MSIFKGFILVLWIFFGLYFGLGGYMSITLVDRKDKYLEMPNTDIQIDDVIYYNMEQFYWLEDRRQTLNTFPWLSDVPQSLATIITALSFGILGGATRLIKQLSFEESVNFENQKVMTIPLLGMLSGIIMLGITFIIPTILTTGDQTLRPTTLVFLTLFAGLFAKRFYDWLSDAFHIIFPKQ